MEATDERAKAPLLDSDSQVGDALKTRAQVRWADSKTPSVFVRAPAKRH